MALKLFVWQQFCPGHSDGLAFALAETEAEAKKLILDENEKENPSNDWPIKHDEFGEVQIYPIEPIAKFIRGGH